VQGLLGQGHARDDLLAMIQKLAQRCDENHEQFDADCVSALFDQAFGHLARSDNSFVLAVSADEEKSLGRSKIFGPDIESKGWWADPYSALEFYSLQPTEVTSAFEKSRLMPRLIQDVILIARAGSPMDGEA
jgi:hypothetical protein